MWNMEDNNSEKNLEQGRGDEETHLKFSNDGRMNISGRKWKEDEDDDGKGNEL